MSGSIWANAAQRNYLCNVGPYGWQTMYMRKITYTMLNRPFWDNIAHKKKTTRTALVQSAQTCFHRKTACSFKWVAAYFLTGYNILNNHSSFFQCWLGSSFMVFGTTMKVCWPWLEHCPHHKRLFEKKLSQVTENNPQFFLWMLLKRN